MTLIQGVKRLTVAFLALIGLAAATAAPAGYCAEWARRLPNLSRVQCEQAGLESTGAHSVKGIPLYQRDVNAPAAGRRPQTTAMPPSAPKGDEETWGGPAFPHEVSLLPHNPVKAPRRVLVLGGIHGDEVSSTSLVFHWIAQARDTAAGMDWRFVPALNPDALLLARPTRVNANGVDLNRNFPTPRWAQEAPVYWEKRTRKDPRRWPGRTALSEPESRFVVETMAKWKPDLIVTVHAPYGVLDYDGPSVPPKRLGRLYLDRVGIFPGSLGHYGGVHKGVPVVTIELPSAIRTPNDAEMRQMWIDLLRWVDERLSLSER
jgi:hypothetical protein